MLWLHWIVFFVSIALQVRVIASLRGGAYKEYPFLFVYSLVLLLTTLADGVIFANFFTLTRVAKYTYFYRNEAVRQFLLLTVVVSLIERTMAESPRRARIRAVLGVLAGFLVLASLYAHSNAPRALLMTQVTRDVSFGSVVLTLLLWLKLISSRTKDRQLLTVTGGLGLQFTGEAIAQSLRQLAVSYHALLIPGNLLGAFAHVLRLYIWSEAFRKPRALQEPATEPEEKPQPVSPQAETFFESNV